VTLRRIRWPNPAEGSTTPLDAARDAAEATVSLGVRELACRLNRSASRFDKAAEDLGRAAQVRISGELLRRVVEAEGQAVRKAEQMGELVPDWTAADCTTDEGKGPTRVYLGSDGVKVPLVTDAEKKGRRQKVRQKRRRGGKKARPLPPSRRGADPPYKEFKLVVYYDETQEHRHVSATGGDHQVAGRLMRRDAGRIALDQADDKVAVVDGAAWIRNQIQRQNLPRDDVGLDFTTGPSTCIRPGGRWTARRTRTERPGPAPCSTRSNTRATGRSGRRWCRGGRSSAACGSGRPPINSWSTFRRGRR
jgi:hypothetical protein